MSIVLADLYEFARLSTAGYVDLATVGSEVLLRNDLSEIRVIAYVNRMKQDIPAHISVVATADVFAKLLDHPTRLVVSDVALPNFHSYWNGELVTKGSWMVVSETGWPSSGNVIYYAVPENASSYFMNFTSQGYNARYYYFTSMDESWKAKYEGPQGAHWGILTKVLNPGIPHIFNGTPPGKRSNVRVPYESGAIIELSYGPCGSSAYPANGRLSKQDQSLQIKVLENGGARLGVRSIDYYESSPPPVTPSPTHPLTVRIVNNGGSQLSISTSMSNVRTDEPLVEALSNAHRVSTCAYCQLQSWINDDTNVRRIKSKDRVFWDSNISFPCRSHRTPHRTVPTTWRAFRALT